MDHREIEYFSFLPDVLILIIISSLPFREAVRTSILSKRWRNFWQCTSNIDLDETLFVKNDEHSIEERAIERNNFEDFIQRWMDNYKEPQVDKFRLVISNPTGHSLRQVKNLITFAVTRRPELKALALDFSDPNWYATDLDTNPQTPLHDFPLNLGAHTSLESLGLSACNFRASLRINAFHALKNLYLGWMEIPGASLNKFLPTCPSLEILILRRLWNVGNLNIDAKRLRVLVVDKCTGPEFISVNAPLLSIFQYCGVSVYMQLECGNNMVEAAFDFGLEPELGGYADADMLFNALYELRGVRDLTICSYVLQVLPFSESYFMNSTLEGVRHLHLRTQLHINDYYGITLFLNSCPFLEVLTIDLGPRRVFEDYEPPSGLAEHLFFTHLWSPMCLKRTLKTVNVRGFKGYENELVVLRYLLKFGKVLEHLDITLSKERGANGVDLESTYGQNVERLMQSFISSSKLQVFVGKYV